MKIQRVMVIMLMMVLILAGVACGEVSTQTARMTLGQGDGADKTFTFNFSITATSDIVVIKRTTATGAEALQTETTHYAVSATNNDYSSGGTVTFVTAPAATEQVLLIRDTPMTQATDYDTGTVRASTHENEDDKQVRLIQELAEEVERCIKIPRSDIASDMGTTLTTIAGRANSTLVFSSTGAIVAGSSTLASSVVPTDYMLTLLDDVNAAAARATLELGTTDDVEFAALAATTGTFSGAITATTGTFSGAITANAGVVLGAGDDLTGSATSDITWGDSKFTVAGATGNTLVAGTFTSTGVATIADASKLATAAAPTDPCDIANKKYVDDTALSLGSYVVTTETGTTTAADEFTDTPTTDGFLTVTISTSDTSGTSSVTINIGGAARAYVATASHDSSTLSPGVMTATIPVQSGIAIDADFTATNMSNCTRLYIWTPLE